jgi:hypothetical protein
VNRRQWLGSPTCSNLKVVNARVRKVVDDFLELSPEDRELAVVEIEAAFEHEDPPEEVQKAWAELIEQRAREVLDGRSTGRDAFEALDELEARLRARHG